MVLICSFSDQNWRFRKSANVTHDTLLFLAMGHLLSAWRTIQRRFLPSVKSILIFLWIIKLDTRSRWCIFYKLSRTWKSIDNLQIGIHRSKRALLVVSPDRRRFSCYVVLDYGLGTRLFLPTVDLYVFFNNIPWALLVIMERLFH